MQAQTTIEKPLTAEQIKQLRRRARNSSNHHLAEVCNAALRGRRDAIATCERMIRATVKKPADPAPVASSGGSTAPAARECPTAPEPGMPCEPMPSEPSRCVYGEHPMPSR